MPEAAHPAAACGAALCLGLTSFLASVFPAARVRAEELAVLGGLTDTDDHSSASYAWALEYRQRLLPCLDASLDYLNEGHVPGHHRDGAGLEFWGRMPLWQDRLSLSLGAGPYLYFDTLTDPTAAVGYRDYHGVGVIATLAASYSLSERWFALLELKQVLAPGDAGTRTLLLGAGYRVEPLVETLGPADDGATLPNELGAFFGETVINGLHSDASNTFGAEYRRRMAPHFELSASLLSDSDGVDGRHQAATAEAWIVQELPAARLVMGLGLGSYVSLQSYRTVYYRPAASVSGLASLTVAWRFTRALGLRLSWHRGFTGDDQDRDIVTLGLGWHF